MVKMNYIGWIVNMTLYLLLVSCSENDKVIISEDIKVTGKILNSRTVYESEHGVTKVYWDTMDHIGLYTDKQVNICYKAILSDSEAGFQAEDSVKLQASEGEIVYAYYPYSSYNLSYNNFKKIELPNIDKQYADIDLQYYDYMYAIGEVTNNEVNLQFKHIFTFLRISIPTDLLQDINNEYKIKIVSSESIAVTNGTFTLDKKEMQGDLHNEIIYTIEKASVKSNEIECYIPMLTQPEHTSIQIYNYTDSKYPALLYSNDTPKGGFEAGQIYTLNLNKDIIENERIEFEAVKEKERKALIDLYNALDGDNWSRSNNNWCSDKPLSEWEGVTILNGRVAKLNLNDYNCNGNIPESIKDLEKLSELVLSNNKITDLSGIMGLTSLKTLRLTNIGCTELPAEIGNLASLEVMDLSHNKLTELPNTLKKLVNLEGLNVSSNSLSTLNPQIYELPNITNVNWSYNQLSGEIPEEIGLMTNLSSLVLSNNQLSGEIPEEIGNCSKLTQLHLYDNCLVGELPEEIGNLTQLFSLALQNNNLTGTIPVSFSHLNAIRSFDISNNRLSGHIPDEVVNSRLWQTVSLDLDKILSQQEGYILTYTPQLKEDDGELKILRTHTKGKGIKLVFMGDGFNKKLIDDGTYDNMMEMGMNYFFSIEPYGSFIDYFDVYSIRVVSQDDYIGNDAVTGLNTAFNDDKVAGNTAMVSSYLSKIPEFENCLNDITTCILLNAKPEDQGYRSVCTLSPNYYGSFSYCIINENLEYIIHHETGGHGIGGLADEYIEYSGSIFEGTVNHNGWDAGNIDSTNDLTQIYWKDFINDERYNNEKIGAYEGAYWEFGIYRATENSIMRASGRFNAPSRWAIYRNIMTLADEEASWENFLEYDVINRETIDRETNSRSVQFPDYNIQKLTAPPVILNQYTNK